jgi:transcriptional regulator of arginine metabolism
MKTRRQAAILRIVRSEPIRSQERLRKRLKAEGFDVTQATLSRDIHEMRLVKTVDADGAARYAPRPEGDVLRPTLEQLAPALLVSLDGVGNQLVIRTPAGSANALASALDRQGWKDVVGTIAGDDTILILTRSDRARRDLVRRLERLAGATEG